MPGRLVVGVWVVLFLASFGVPVLMDVAVHQEDRVRLARRRVREMERRQYSPDNPFRQERMAEKDPYLAAAERVFAEDSIAEQETLSERLARIPLDSAHKDLERAVQAQRWTIAGVLGTGLVWVLAFVFVTVGTGRWVTARDGWTRVQSWHGGKLLMLYVPFTAAAVLYASAGTIPVDNDAAAAAGVLFVTSALLLLACGAMLVRATWNWLTGREGKRRVGSTPGNHVSLRSRFVTSLLQLMRRPRAAAAMWLILGLLIGAIAATFALRPRTYADCILRGMKYTPTATATRALQQACGQKFGSVSQQTSGAVFSRRAPRAPRAAEAPRAPEAPRPPRAPRAPRR